MNRSLVLIVIVALPAACAPARTRIAPLPAMPFAVDSATASAVGEGVTLRSVFSPTGPWSIRALDVNVSRCNRAMAVKGFTGAIGRERVSVLLDQLADSIAVVAGVNADFFLFTPPGVPTGTMVVSGRVVTGPTAQPVLAIDSAGRPHVTTFGVAGRARIGAATVPLESWNRAASTGVAFFDSNWGVTTDTATSLIEVVVDASGTVTRVDTARSGVDIPRGGFVLMSGRRSTLALRTMLGATQLGDSAAVQVSLEPFHPRDAVGGRPVLARGGASVVEHDSSAFATTRHPRTAAGVTRDGHRLILVVVDGRQKPYSDGMSLRELASVMIALGSHDAINLDGGGSTAMVVTDPATGSRRVANRPSDAGGERAVGNALAIVRSCR